VRVLSLGDLKRGITAERKTGEVVVAARTSTDKAEGSNGNCRERVGRYESGSLIQGSSLGGIWGSMFIMDNELGEGSGLLLQGSSSGVDFGDGSMFTVANELA
jgi:hypothetical protein